MVLYIGGFCTDFAHEDLVLRRIKSFKTADAFGQLVTKNQNKISRHKLALSVSRQILKTLRLAPYTRS